jgi:drug/metabolite transporter (DMT)-like permease
LGRIRSCYSSAAPDITPIDKNNLGAKPNSSALMRWKLCAIKRIHAFPHSYFLNDYPMPFSSSGRWLPPLALVVLSMTWGYTWVLAKQALVYAPPFVFAAERCVGGALALILALKLMGRPIKLEAPWPTLGIGLAQVSGFMVFQTWALVEGGPGKTAVLIFTMPIWTLLMAWPILGERIIGKQWLAALSTLAGLLLIIEPWDMHSSLFSKFLGVMAALCWAIGTILIKRLRSRHQVDLLALTAWQMILGSVPLVLLAWVVPERGTNWTVTYMGILAFMSIASTAMCWWLWIYILDRVPAWEASLSVLGTPVVAILSSRLMLDEKFKASEVTGILLIGGGLALLSLMGWAASRKATLKV